MQTEPSALAALSWIARGKAFVAKSNRITAEDWMRSCGAPERAIRVIKSPVGGGPTATIDVSTGLEIGAWSDAMRTASAYYRILNDGGFTKIPMHRRIGMVTSSPSAGVVAEGVAIPVSQIVLNNVTL